jgi:hypothetical protein
MVLAKERRRGAPSSRKNRAMPGSRRRRCFSQEWQSIRLKIASPPSIKTINGQQRCPKMGKIADFRKFNKRRKISLRIKGTPRKE